MLNLTIICVGKLKEKYFRDAESEYKKRLTRFCKLDIIELPDEKIPDNPSESERLQVLEKEGRKILSHIKNGTPIVATCIEGSLVSSEELAEITNEFAMNSGKAAFIIGGSLGLYDEIKKRAEKRLSFGRITLPHQLMRVVLLEQLYRAFKISNNESYHK